MSVADHLIYALLWLGFAMSHSVLAGADLRRGMGRLVGRAHRLVYNALALLALLAVLATGHWLAGSALPFMMPLALRWVMNAAVIAGLVLGWVALRSYHLGAFIGTAQLRGADDTAAALSVSGLHRWIRHPLYSAVLLIVWGMARSELDVATACWVTLYLIIGSRIEEQRLIARYGDAYRRYRSTTPAFLPRWRRATSR
ncbi:methyltransferase family protein [Sphingomonas sp. HMP6]|uniref:methyltransferase family protein n=1 Tax=Sphingomonas sp. HMP6 TaxID=1517551 RepID=UPI001596E4CE|nr:isoprenylcysteine carboxylmethyltransferase family protein [Sphingomonas sp. HMP6]BCA59438.1 hypothetical protein HMP06_2207 [Sphingomonas sp. HMP6]